MADIDTSSPEFQEAVKAAATKLAEDTIKDNYVPASEVKGLKDNKDEILDKYAKLKKKYEGIDESSLEELKRVAQARQNDEIVDLIMKGKLDEAKTRMTSDVITPWKQKTDELTEQFTTAQNRLKEYESLLQEKDQTVQSMQKRNYFRELVAGDDSFKKDYLNDYIQLNEGKVSIDPETGVAYAMDNGKPMLDTDGNKIPFDKYYAKQKVGSGLFWNGGQGSGASGKTAGEGLPSDVKKWTSEQKVAYIEQYGAAEYAKVVAGK